MAPLPIALDPGRCPGKTRLSGTKVGICVLCGCRKDARHTIEPAAAFVDGIWRCENWRGHGVRTVSPDAGQGKPPLLGPSCNHSEHTDAVMCGNEQEQAA